MDLESEVRKILALLEAPFTALATKYHLKIHIDVSLRFENIEGFRKVIEKSGLYLPEPIESEKTHNGTSKG